jgi:hypothetical protein
LAKAIRGFPWREAFRLNTNMIHLNTSFGMSFSEVDEGGSESAKKRALLRVSPRQSQFVSGSPTHLSAIVTPAVYAAEVLLEPFAKHLANTLRAASDGTLQAASLAT